MTKHWDNERETGIESPVRLSISEGGIALLTATGPTPEDALTSALCLLESAHERTGRDDAWAVAVAEAAQIMNDASISVAESG
jgi:hypothetical protein